MFAVKINSLQTTVFDKALKDRDGNNTDVHNNIFKSYQQRYLEN